MKKIINRSIFGLFLLYVFLTFPAFSASAQSASLSLDVSGTLKAGKTFQVTISCSSPLYALQLDIDYDASRIACKSVKSASSEAYVRSRQSDTRTSVVFSGSRTTSGALIVCTFKTLIDGESQIVFTPLSSVDASEQLTDFDKALTLNITAGSNASYKTDTAPKKDAPSPTNSPRPILDSRSSSDESRSQMIPDEFHTKPPIWRYVLIAVCIAGLVAATLIIGIQIGKRSKKKPPADPREPEIDNTLPPDHNEKS